MISDRVVANAVRYRGSAVTSPTLIVAPIEIAAPVNPLAIGNIGYFGGPGPLHATFVTSPSA